MDNDTWEKFTYDHKKYGDKIKNLISKLQKAKKQLDQNKKKDLIIPEIKK